jgi:hypothetical protein
MADDPSKDVDRKQLSNHNETDNPFILFRRFADEQANIFRRFAGDQFNSFSTMFGAMPSSFARYHNYCERKWRHQGQPGSDRNSDLGAQDDDHHDDETPFERMFNDFEKAIENELQELDKLMKAKRTSEPAQNGDSRGEQEPNTWYWTWSFPRDIQLTEEEKERRHQLRKEHEKWQEDFEHFLRNDLDSPLQLEQENQLQAIPWRHAFEDLVRISNGLELAPYFVHNPVSSYIRQLKLLGRVNFEDFLARDMVSNPEVMESQKRSRPEERFQWPGSAGWSKQLPSEGGALVKHEAEFTNELDAEPQTELDMYKRFLGGSVSSSSPPSQRSSNPTPDSKGNASVMSTLTTTESMVNPDGTVTTKVVLKKRFADGREESSETIRTTPERHDKQGTNKIQPKQIVGDSNLKAAPKSEERRRGWFWSS